jgi:hypothetical protein
MELIIHGNFFVFALTAIKVIPLDFKLPAKGFYL